MKANKGAPGVDEVTLEKFETDLKSNLYKIRELDVLGQRSPTTGESGGVYPKSHGGGTRMLGVPTVVDRIAQTVVAGRIEAKVEPPYSLRLLWLSSEPVGQGRGGGMPAAMLEVRLDHRHGYPEVLRQRSLGPRAKGGAGALYRAVGGGSRNAVAGCTA